MKSGGPWNLRGLRPETLAAARDAARRSGVSVGEWLNDLIEQTDDYGRASLRPADHADDDHRGWPLRPLRDDERPHARPRPPRRDYESNDDRVPARHSVLAVDELNEVYARLDRLTDQIEELARRKPPLRGAPTPPHGARRLGEEVAPDSAAAADMPASNASASPDVPSPATVPPNEDAASEGEPSVQFPELEEQLRRLTAQIESMRSSGLDSVIAAFRGDLAEIRRQLTEALPRQAVESLCVEVEALARRIDRSRARTGDSDAIAGIERGLAEVRDALGGMTTAESLVGFDEALKALAQKLDFIIAREDPAALRQLETAIGALRGVVSHVASNDALNKVAEDVRNLGAKVDSLAKTSASGQAVSALGNRIDSLTDAINASAEINAPRGLEKLLSETMEKLESVRINTDPAAFKQLEERIAQLIGKLDASDARLGKLTAVERSVTDLLSHIDELRGAEAAPAAADASARPAVDAIARDVAEIKRSEQRTKDSLEAVHGTVEQVVGRLAMIESDIHDVAMRAPRSQMSAPTPADPAHPAVVTPRPGAPTAPAELIGGAERQDFIAAARRATQAATAPGPESRSPRRRGTRHGASGDMQSRKPSRLRKLLVMGAIVLFTASLLQIGWHVFQDSRLGEEISAPWQHPAPLPAASDKNPNAPQPQSGSSQPGSLQPGSLQPGALEPSGRAEPLPAAASVAVSLVAPAPGGAQDAPAAGSAGGNSAPNAALAPTPQAAPIAMPSPPTPSPPTPSPPTPNPQPSAAPAVAPSAPPAVSPAPAATQSPSQLPPPSAADPTGALPPRMTSASPPPSHGNSGAMNAPELAIDALPSTIGGPVLRAAAAAGDMAAQYEIAVRFGEGRGVPRNERQAASWLELAAKQGLAPAQFRLGGYYEKGIGVKKDLAAARDLYLAAAAKGNAKAMHNLAVLYADGVNGRSDYHTAALWFRKAADRGIADSQYNLAILYARGSGEPQNYVEAYKWFALAAKQGDVEAANKRDDIAAQLDEPTLAAADLVVRSWKPEPQPDEAVKVKAPPGGWDAAAPTPKIKPRTKSAGLDGLNSATN